MATLNAGIPLIERGITPDELNLIDVALQKLVSFFENALAYHFRVMVHHAGDHRGQVAARFGRHLLVELVNVSTGCGYARATDRREAVVLGEVQEQFDLEDQPQE